MDCVDPINPAVSAVVIYIILIMLLYITKPDFIYDHKQNKFKETNFNNQSIPPIPIFYIVGAIASIIIYYILYFASCSTYTKNYKYVSSNQKYRFY